jgi:hypothetical protein
MTDRIEFTPTAADLAAAARDARPRNWGRRDRLRFVLAGISIALLLFFLFASYVWRWWDLFILRWEDIAAFAFAGGVMGWIYSRAPTLQANDPRLAPRRLVLGTEGFATSGDGYDTKIDWRAISGIADRADTIFFTTRWNETFFVPKSAFADRAAAEAFRRRAEELWSQRASNRPPSAG